MITLGEKGKVKGEEYLVPLDDQTYAHPESFGKPTYFPILKPKQSLVCAFHRFVKVDLFICETIGDVHLLWYLLYDRGAGEKLEWFTGFIEKGIFFPPSRP